MGAPTAAITSPIRKLVGAAAVGAAAAISRRSSQGNPSVGGVKHKSRI